MGKAVTDAFLDGGIDKISTSTSISICTAEPTSIGECTSLSLITPHAMTGGDFTPGNGTPDGREVTVAQQADLAITGTGDANHVVIFDATDWYVTTATTQTLTSGGTVTIPAWTITFRDPV